MKRKLLFFTMLCFVAFSANACGTDGVHQPMAENETANDNGEDGNGTEESGKGLFDLTQGEKRQATRHHAQQRLPHARARLGNVQLAQGRMY